MGLSKCKLGKYIELREITNADYSLDVGAVRGVNNLRQLMPTKADLNGRDLSKFQIVYPGEFVFNHRTSRNGSKFSIAYNDSNKPVIMWHSALERKRERSFLPNGYIFFNCAEFDCYASSNSWGSSTEFYNWEDLCEVEVDLPSLCVQQKYVDIYNAMVANQQAYERGLEDLKLTCDGYIEDLRRKMPCEKIGKYIELTELTNENSQYGIDDVMGISIEKKLIRTKADMKDVNLAPYLLIQPNEFAYVTVTSRNGGKISIALNDTGRTYICSSSYVVFRSKNIEELLPQYLILSYQEMSLIDMHAFILGVRQGKPLTGRTCVMFKSLFQVLRCRSLSPKCTPYIADAKRSMSS